MRRKKGYFEIEADGPNAIEISVFHRVMFSEVDALGIAWHGRCPSFFEKAHAELMDKVGLSYDNYKSCGVGAPIVQLHVDYCSPLILDEVIEIKASLIYTLGARINVDYQILHKDGSLALKGYTVQMFFDLTSHEPYMVDPEIYAECKRCWIAGDFR